MDAGSKAVVLSEQRDGWLTIMFNQPERRNPLTEEVINEVSRLLDEARDNEDVRAIVFAGAGGVFSAGADLAAFQKMMAAGEGAERLAYDVSLTAAALFAKVASQPQMTVAVIEGAAMAGGLGLACACDFVLAHDDAILSFSETRLGLPPAQIAPYVVKRIGSQKAKRLLVLGGRLTGSEAYALGLVDRVAHDADEMAEAVVDLKCQLTACGPFAVAQTKELLETLQSGEGAGFQENAAQIFARCIAGEECREGVMAFMQKRPAKWAE